MLEIIAGRPQRPQAAPHYAVLDFDGTLSLIREGWQQIMIPYFAEELAATPKGREIPLETLTLQNAGVDDAALHDFASLKLLRILDVTENSGLSARAVDSLKQALPTCSILCSQLVYDVDFSGHLVRSDETSLSLPACGITTLTGLEGLTAIETLNLRGNQIESVYNIQISHARDTLLDLNLADNRLNNVDSLVALTRIEKLDLSGNQITVINPLMQLNTLRTLNLSGNPIPADQVEILRAALPNCEITF